MASGKFKGFSERLIFSMKSKGYTASRSPSGICMQTLSNIANASEQICRRYIRGDALPDFERVRMISKQLEISPGWLLFGEENDINSISSPKSVDDDLLHYLLKQSHHLYKGESEHTNDYADFVMELVRDIREIDTSNENLEKIIDLAISSIASYKEKRKRKVTA